MFTPGFDCRRRNRDSGEISVVNERRKSLGRRLFRNRLIRLVALHIATFIATMTGLRFIYLSMTVVTNDLEELLEINQGVVVTMAIATIRVHRFSTSIKSNRIKARVLKKISV